MNGCRDDDDDDGGDGGFVVVLNLSILNRRLFMWGIFQSVFVTYSDWDQLKQTNDFFNNV